MVSPQVADILSQQSVHPVESLKSSIVELPLRASTASGKSSETIQLVVCNEAYQYSASFSEHFVLIAIHVHILTTKLLIGGCQFV